MLGIFLQILSILGIILLAVLALSAAVLLLVLFFPVFYRISGEKDESGLRVRAKMRWLFGLLRVNYRYPEPGRLTVRFLWFKLYDAKITAGGEEGSGEKNSDEKRSGAGKVSAEKSGDKMEKAPDGEPCDETGKNPARETAVKAENISVKEPGDETEKASAENLAHTDRVSSESVLPGGEVSATGADGGNTESSASPDSEDRGQEASGDENTGKGKISQKIAKIKYTIRNIYDKIKEIWENIKYYIELLQEEDTKQLFSHVWFRLCKILRHIRPRHLRADVLFGAGSPDITGYAYGAYCMLSSALGPGFRVTPDFDRAVLKAEFEVSGRITLWVLLVNALKLLLDRKLRQFIGKMKAGKRGRLKA